MSLPDVLGEGSGGSLGWSLTLQWLNDRYLSPMCEESRRVEDMSERAALYRDDGAPYMHRLIDKVFEDQDIKRLRHEWVEQAGYNNVTRRVVHELATLYNRHAMRSVGGDDNNVRYQTVLSLVGLNSIMLEVQRLAILYRAVWIHFRVPAWSRVPQIDIVEPHHFRVVTHPLEPTRVVAMIVDQAPHGPWFGTADRPQFLVWTETERFQISQKGNLVGGEDAIQPHSFGRIPGVLARLSPPPGAVMDTTTFRDVIRAHKAVWFENVLLLKESKSATRTSVLSGDTARVARKQAIDTQTVVELPEGVTLTPADLSMDLAPFRDTADHILERAAANHGIPPAILHHEGATSGYEIELRHVGIRERRIEQEPVFRALERDLAECMATVLTVDRPDLAFTTEGWSINYGDAQMPRTPMEDLQIFEAEQRLLLTDLIEEEMRRDPDIDRAVAWERVNVRVADKTRIAEITRPLQALQGGANAGNDTASQGNGASTTIPRDGFQAIS